MSNGQDDDAKKAIDIARRKLAAGDLEGAIRFAKKSIAMQDTVTAKSLLRELEALQKEGKSSTASGSAGSANAGPSRQSNGTASGSKARSSSSSAAPEASTSVKRDYTSEQAALVKRVRSCKITEYYEILSLQKGCEEVMIKKAYRKLALSLHPDKVSIATSAISANCLCSSGAVI